MKQTDELTFVDGVKACLPTVLGYLGIGIAAGVVGKTSGLSLLEIILLAAVVYAGAAQFIISGMLALASPLSAIIVTTFLINSRNALMSMAVAPTFKKASLWSNVGIGSLLTDESFAVAMNRIGNKKAVTLLDAWSECYGLYYVDRCLYYWSLYWWVAAESRSIWIGFCTFSDVYRIIIFTTDQ